MAVHLEFVVLGPPVSNQSPVWDLERLFQLRSAVAHGFAAPAVDPSAVRLLVETTRCLLTGSQPAKQTA